MDESSSTSTQSVVSPKAGGSKRRVPVLENSPIGVACPLRGSNHQAFTFDPLMTSIRTENGRPIGNPNDGFAWHTDQYYFERPTAYTFLYGIETPPVGADTQFCSTRPLYEELSDEQLFHTQWVHVELPPEEFPGYKGERVICERCGESISFRREVRHGSKVLCRGCAGERYYEPIV